MPRVATGKPHKQFLEQLRETVDSEVLDAFADRINPLKSVTRPNDYFFHAAELKNGSLIQALAAMGFTPNTCDRLDHGIHVAVNAGDVETARAMLNAGSRVDLKDETGETGLMIAAARGDLPMVELFVSRGAKPTAENEDGQSPIVLAANNGYRAVVNRLTPVSSVRDQKLVEQILARPTEPDLGAEEFHRLRCQAIRLSRRPEKMKEMRKLLDQGLWVDIPDPGGSTALMGANRPSDLDLADFLLEYGASADAADNAGQTALDWSVWGDNPVLFNRLYEMASTKTRQQGRRLLKRLQKANQCQHEGWDDIAGKL